MIENNVNKLRNVSHKFMTRPNSKVIVGYWVSEKKSQKFGVKELSESCIKRGLSFQKIDLDHDVDNKCDYQIIIHKLAAMYALALTGDLKAKAALKKIDKIVEQNPSVVFIDPLSSIQKLLLRTETYELLRNITQKLDKTFTPTYVVLENEDVDANIQMLEESLVSFPVVCKPVYAGGCKEAHQMVLLFNKDQLQRYCTPPCLVQSFINHNAVLYKVFIIGVRWFITTRPSLKNFQAGNFDAICFNSHNVSKPDCRSPLTCQDASLKPPKADLRILEKIVLLVKEALRSELLGIDVIIDVAKGKHGIIDINSFPSYESVADVNELIADMIRKRFDEGENFSAKPQFCLSTDIEQKYILQDISTFTNNFNTDIEGNLVQDGSVTGGAVNEML